MKVFNATKNTESVIELKDREDLQNLYDTISDEEDFIIEWEEGDVCHSEVVVANKLLGKVRNGDLKLVAKKPTEE